MIYNSISIEMSNLRPYYRKKRTKLSKSLFAIFVKLPSLKNLGLLDFSIFLRPKSKIKVTTQV